MSARELLNVIDDLKEKISNEEYLKLTSLLVKRNNKEGKEYTITYIKQKSLIRPDGDVVFQQEIKTKIAKISERDVLEIKDNLMRNVIIKIGFKDGLLKIDKYQKIDLVANDEENDPVFIRYNDKILLSIKPTDDI